MLLDAFGATFLTVLVPPWNRLEPQLVERLTRLRLLGPLDLRPPARPRGRAGAGPGQHPSRPDRLARRPPVHRRGGSARAASSRRSIRTSRSAFSATIWPWTRPAGASSSGCSAFLTRHPATRLCPAGELFESGRMSAPLLQIEDLEVDFLADEGRGRGGAGRVASRSRRARPSPWSARAARARP